MPRQLFMMGLGTLVLMGGFGLLLVVFFHDTSILSLLTSGLPLGLQLGAGLLIGLLSSGIALWLITRKFFFNQYAYYQKLIHTFTWNPFSIFFVSVCAGVGEELLFRAGIQPFLGIGWTSVLFVALHGYLNPTNWRISVYGIFMVGIIAGFGYLFEKWGIVTVMVAHTIFDWVLLTVLTKKTD